MVRAAFISPCNGMRKCAARLLKNRRNARQMAGMDDRMLADIGLTRSDLRDAYAQPLWRDPTDVLAGRARDKRDQSPRPCVDGLPINAPSIAPDTPLDPTKASAVVLALPLTTSAGPAQPAVDPHWRVSPRTKRIKRPPGLPGGRCQPDMIERLVECLLGQSAAVFHHADRHSESPDGRDHPPVDQPVAIHLRRCDEEIRSKPAEDAFRRLSA